MNLQINAESRVIHVLASGEFELGSARRSFVRIIDSVEKNRVAKVLFDGREIIGEPSVVERFLYGEFVADAVARLMQSPRFNNSPQLAYVLHPPVLDPHRLGETVAVNRGVNGKAFDNIPDALQWLGLDPDSVFQGGNGVSNV